MTSDPKPSFRAWLVVALLCVVGGLNYLDRNMITTMRTSIVAAVPMSDAQFGLLTSVFLWIYGLLSPFAGFLADRFSRSRVIIVSLFVWSAVTWLTAHATTFEGLLVARALMGISEACYIPAALALIADYHRGTTRSFATGVHLAGIMIGQGLGGVGGWIAERHAWQVPFAIFGGVGIAYSCVLLFALKDAPRESTATSPADSPAADSNVSFGAALRSLFGNGSFILALAFFGLLGVVGWGLVGWLPTYFQERFHLGQGEAGFSATGYLNAASFAGVLLGGFLADRFSKTNPRARILVPAVGLCIAAVGVLMLSVTTVLAVAIAGIVIYGVTRTFTDANMMPILCLIADPRYRATGYGVLNLLSCTIGGLGIYAGGALRDAKIDLGTMFLFVVVCLVVCATLLFALKPRTSLATHR
ncbi:MAG: MFS transporter [Verrucomicrobia bacterium]|nr:MFS transporter [Verrucomicrobiota bacterium]